MQTVAERANSFIRHHDRIREAARSLSRPARATPLPVLMGQGRGLRVRVGASTLMRVVSTVEAEVESAFLKAIEPGAVVYDLGANIGWFALLAARKTGPGGSVTAFEPLVENAALLERNAATNRLQNVKVVPAAVGAEDGWASFSMRSSLKGRLSEEGECSVPILSLDRWIADGNAPPDVIKMDIEGAEAAALRGMAGTLAEHQPTLFIELHNTNRQVADLLDEFGYAHRPLDDPAPTRDAEWCAHIFGQPA